MYTQIFFVTSVRGRVFAPQMAANASLIFFNVALVMVVFVVLVGATVVLVVMAIEGGK